MNGILNLNKPAGFTSFDCIAVLRRLSGERRIGHTGTLDPEATGVLPLCFGQAARLIEYMDDMPKTYICEAVLGLVTDSRDIWGNIIIDIRPEIPEIREEKLLKELESFRGEITQIPPIFSSIKVDGKRLYSYAREGKTVEIPPRQVTIHNIKLLEYNKEEGRFKLEIKCSRGTYVRSICHDLGQALGCGASMSSLVRTSTCGFNIEDSVDLETLRSAEKPEIEKYLMPMDIAARNMPALELNEREARLFINGFPEFYRGEIPEKLPCAVFFRGKFLGIAGMKNDNFRPLKVFNI